MSIKFKRTISILLSVLLLMSAGIASPLVVRAEGEDSSSQIVESVVDEEVTEEAILSDDESSADKEVLDEMVAIALSAINIDNMYTYTFNITSHDEEIVLHIGYATDLNNDGIVDEPKMALVVPNTEEVIEIVPGEEELSVAEIHIKFVRENTLTKMTVSNASIGTWLLKSEYPISFIIKDAEEDSSESSKPEESSSKPEESSGESSTESSEEPESSSVPEESSSKPSEESSKPQETPGTTQKGFFTEAKNIIMILVLIILIAAYVTYAVMTKKKNKENGESEQTKKPGNNNTSVQAKPDKKVKEKKEKAQKTKSNNKKEPKKPKEKVTKVEHEVSVSEELEDETERIKKELKERYLDPALYKTPTENVKKEETKKKEEVQPVYVTKEDLDNDETIESVYSEDDIRAAIQSKDIKRARVSFFPEDRFGD